MLRKLTVENYALIERLDIEFGPSLNIITGETGAGKSILLGALGLLCGNRCDASVIKDRERNCVVEGIFEIGNYGLEYFFADNDLDYDPATIVRRVISPTGKNRAYINDLPVQVTALKDFGSRVIDIHSQHQSLLLTEEGFRTGILDSVAGQQAVVGEYAAAYHSMRAAQRDLKLMRDNTARDRQDEEWLRHQIEKLSGAGLREDEQEEIETEQSELSHAEEITSVLAAGVSTLGEDGTGVIEKLKAAEHGLLHIGGFYGRAAEFAERLRGTILELRDMESEFESEAARMEYDPARLEKLNDRLDIIYSLQQKHRVGSIGELIRIKEGYEKRLSAITGNGEALAELEDKLARHKIRVEELAGKITDGRKKTVGNIGRYVEKMLDSLGMPESRFSVEVEPAGCFKASGADNIRFLFSANKNISPAPVEKIASGGEISRLMLALKSAVAKSSRLPTIIFDEIDSGVSGRIAYEMGNIIGELADSMQVINITHLPQVASKGKVHFYVYKDSSSGVSQTKIRLLTTEERIAEIAKMISGKTTTDAAATQAKLLLGI